MTFSLKSMGSWTILLLMFMQFVPLNRINQPAPADFETLDSIKHSLKKACYDCHSNETRWPGIAYIAPVSWFLSSTVSSGRNVLNFSIWNNNNKAERDQQKKKIGRIIAAGSKHQRLYYLWSPEAQLTESERKMLLCWFTNSRGEQPFRIKNSGNNRQDKTL